MSPGPSEPATTVSRDAAPAQVTGPVNGAEPGRRRLLDLDRDDALRLLASVPFGRVVFTMGALPAIRPVNHIIDLGQIIIRTRVTAKVADAAATQTVVAYEADDIDPVQRLGWSVVVTGIARTITDPARVAEYERLLHPWVDMYTDSVIAIDPGIVTGFRLIEDSRDS